MAFTSVASESLLFSHGGEQSPPLSHSPPSPMADDLCAINYSPRFPHGHYLNPAFVRVYLLGDELGSGGYGFVMTALHRRHKLEVAVKFVIKAKVPEQAWVNHDTLGKIPMEVMLLRIVNHENIVKCFDVFEDELFFYVVSPVVFCPCRLMVIVCRFKNCMDLRGARGKGRRLLTSLRLKCRHHISLPPLRCCPPRRLSSLCPNRNRIPLLRYAVNSLLSISAFQTLRPSTMSFTIFPFQKSSQAFPWMFRSSAILAVLHMTCSSASNRRSTSVSPRDKLGTS